MYLLPTRIFKDALKKFGEMSFNINCPYFDKYPFETIFSNIDLLLHYEILSL